MDKLLGWLKVLGVALGALQHTLNVLPFLPAWVAPAVAGFAVIVDDMPTVLGHIGDLMATFNPPKV